MNFISSDQIDLRDLSR